MILKDCDNFFVVFSLVLLPCPSELILNQKEEINVS
jgi:hypothetical protein